MPIRLDHPHMLWLLLLALPIAWLGMRSLMSMHMLQRRIAIGARLVVLLVIVLMLAGLQSVRWHDGVTVVAVLDESQSVHRFAKPPEVDRSAPVSVLDDPLDATSMHSWLQSWIRQASKEQEPDDRFGMVGFDARPSVYRLPSVGMNFDAAGSSSPRAGSDIAGGIRLGMATFPPDSNKRMLLATDGNTTSGSDATGSDVLEAAREARAAGIPIDVIPIDFAVDREVMVEGLYAPTELREGQTISMRVVLRATAPTPGELFLTQDGQVLDLNRAAPGRGLPVREAEWTAESSAETLGEGARNERGYVCVRVIDLPASYSGVNKFEAIFEPEQQADTMSANNRAESFTLVHGQGRVLFVDGVGGDEGMVLPTAMRQRDINLDVVTPRELPESIDGLQRYDAIVMQDVPAEMVAPELQRDIETYVTQLGGGLLVVGGPQSFAAGGWTNSPIDRILPVDCQVPGQMEIPNGALVIIVDVSGSMQESMAGTNITKQSLANNAAALAISTLFRNDYLGVIAFNYDSEWIVPLGPNDNPGQAIQAVRKMGSAGGTDIYHGLTQAYSQLRQLPPRDVGVRHMLLLTDGHSPSEGFASMAEAIKAEGMTLSTVGVGNDVNDAALEALAKFGGGTYYPVKDATTLPQIFIKEARVVRRALIKEVTFQPAMRSTGSPIARGLGQPPSLHGFIVTGRKADRRVFNVMDGPEGEPLFAHWQVGLGRTAAFTSDAHNRWATDWLGWDGYADFWARTMRTIARPSDSRQYELLTTIDRDTLKVRLDMGSDSSTPGNSDSEASPLAYSRVKGALLTPDGRVEEIALSQTGPGVFEARVPADEQGNYIVNLFAENARGDRKAIFGGVSKRPGAELHRFASNRALLEQVAELTGGKVYNLASPTGVNLFDRQGLPPTRSIQPLWRVLLGVLLVAFLLDVAARRITIDVPAVRATLASTFGTNRRREESDATFASLRKRKQTAETQTTGSRTAAPPEAVPEAAPAERLTRRQRQQRRAQEPAAVAPAAKSADTAAKPAARSTPAAAPPPPKAADPAPAEPRTSDDSSMTSRLLAAKRRANEDKRK